MHRLILVLLLVGAGLFLLAPAASADPAPQQGRQTCAPVNTGGSGCAPCPPRSCYPYYRPYYYRAPYACRPPYVYRPYDCRNQGGPGYGRRYGYPGASRRSTYYGGFRR